MDQERWAGLLVALDLPNSLQSVGEDLIARHAERHRAYHTKEHISALLTHLDAMGDLARRPALIELAIWFHDAIYRPTSKTNEADSAALARRALEGHLPEADLDWIETAIVLTADHGETSDPDTQLLLDLDLSILGTAPDIYAQYTRDIRREYKWVPRPLYRSGRAKVLQHFLDMSHIYKREETAALWERQARENLMAELRIYG